MAKTAKAFDFSALDLKALTDKPVEIELVHPDPDNREPLGVFVSVVGSESETFQRFVREKSNAARLKAFQDNRKKGAPQPPTYEEEETALLEAIAACVTGWRTIIDGQSEPVILWGERRLEFTPANALEVLRQFRWMCGQINDATGDLSNFIKA